MRSTYANMWSRRHLLWVLVVSNLKRQNKNSMLGYLWWLLDPILMTLVYFVVVALLFRRGGDNQPFILFLLCGLLCWKAFNDSVAQSITTLRGASGIIRAISFPKAVLPISLVLSNSVYFIFALIVAMIVAALYGIWPNVYYLLLPLVIFFQILFTAGLCLILSTMGLYFADTGNIMNHVLRMWYFLSPGIYSVTQVPEHLRLLFRLNPLCELMESYRAIIMWGRMPTAFDLGYALFCGAFFFLVGFMFFRRFEGRMVAKL